MKKTIFIDARTGSDFTLDAVWAGLVDRLGWENVVDWPPSEKHREGIPQVTGDVEKDYGWERRTLCYTPHHDKFSRLSLREVNDLILKGQVERFFVDERHDTYRFWLQTAGRHTNIPVVVVAGHDRFWNDSIGTVQRYYGHRLEALFLDNWIPDYSMIPGAFPMKYAVNFDHVWDAGRREEFLKNKLYNLCFMGYNSQGERAVMVDHLLKKYGSEGNCLFVEKRPNTMDAFLPKREYFQRIAQSRICINLNGAAQCGKTLRFYEIPYVGSYMLSQRHDPWGLDGTGMLSGVHCDYFSNIDEMDRWIDWALTHPEEREAIARAGHEKVMTFHTARARVDYIYRCLEMLKGKK